MDWPATPAALAPPAAWWVGTTGPWCRHWCSEFTMNISMKTMIHKTIQNKPAGTKFQRGVAAVELGLLLPFILFPLTFGITEFGRAMAQYNTMVKNVRDGSRYLSQLPAGPTNHDAAKCLVVFGNIACTEPALLPGLTTAMVTVEDSVTNPTPAYLNVLTPGGGTLNLVSVTVTGYPFTFIVDFGIPNFTFEAISSTMRQS
jgi:TadE-like protein